jgi:predicted porin
MFAIVSRVDRLFERALTVAGAVMAFASTANAGITNPAGDWTVDSGGNVNAYYTNKSTDDLTGSYSVNGASSSGSVSGTGYDDRNTIGTGLLPSAFGIGAKTRQNDLDIAFQFSFFTGSSSGTAAAGGNNTLNIRQAFLTFGDASWGTIKAGRDLGIFGSDAILSDMTLLGVGVSGPGASAAGGSSTLGRIGSGYIYADWKGQMSYTSPNWNGFQVAAGAMEGFNNGGQDLGFEAKATYDFAANDVSGRVWMSGLTQKTDGAVSYTSKGFDIGGKVAYQGFGLVGYYYTGDGLDSQANGNVNVDLTTPANTLNSLNAVVATGGLFNGTGYKTEDSGGYIQGTFVVPGVGTKLGVSYGQSNSKGTVGPKTGEFTNESWIVGAYHPLTKSLNLVAEYTMQEIGVIGTQVSGNNTYKVDANRESNTISLGAILFF